MSTQAIMTERMFAPSPGRDQVPCNHRDLVVATVDFVRSIGHHARPVPPLRRPTNRHPLRAWQTRALEAMAAWERAPDRPFLLSAAPGAGKTRPALELARRQLASGAATAVVIACPTAPLTRQWARAAAELGLDLAPDADSPKPPIGFHGVAVTYARIAKSPNRWAAALPRTDAGRRR